MTTLSTSLRLVDIFKLSGLEGSEVKHLKSRFLSVENKKKNIKGCLCRDCSMDNRDIFKAGVWVAKDLATNIYHRSLRCALCAKHIPAVRTQGVNGNGKVW